MRIGTEDLKFFKENEGKSFIKVFFFKYLKSLGECKRYIAIAILVTYFPIFWLYAFFTDSPPQERKKIDNKK